MFYIEKQEREVFKGITIDYSKFLLDDEEISTYTFYNNDKGIITEPQINGKYFIFTVQGGSDGERHTIEIEIKGTKGSVKRTFVLVEIKNEI